MGILAYNNEFNMKTFQFFTKYKLVIPSMKLSIVIIVTALVFLDYSVYCQRLNNISLAINDSVVIKSKRHDVLKLLLNLKADIEKNDSLLIENFFRIVPTNIFIFDTVPINSKENCRYNALFYEIENDNGEYIQPRLIVLHTNQQDSFDNRKTFRYLDTLRLQYKSSRKKKIIFKSNDLVLRGDTSLFVYLDIDEFHHLQKGTYYLSLYYCNEYDHDKITYRFPNNLGANIL